MSAAPGLLQAVQTTLTASLPELAGETCDRIYAELEAYALVDRDDLKASVARNLDLALLALRSGRAPSPDELTQADQTAQERYEAGMPIEEIIRGFRVSIALIHERFVDVGISLGLPVSEVLDGSRILWDVGDAFTSRVVTTYRGLEVSAALADATRRADAVRALLAGRLPEDPAPFGIDPRRRYAAVRCRVAPGTQAEAVRARLELTGSVQGAPALVVISDQSCLGMVSTRPVPPEGAAVGIGPFVPVEELARSDRTAKLALDVAERLGRTGLQGVEELGWRLAAASRPDVWRLYRDRYLAPVLGQGAFGAEVLGAVRAWLQHGRSIPRASEALMVHVNTTRYRLGRYCELTGADLDDPDDLVGVVWALGLPEVDPDIL